MPIEETVRGELAHITGALEDIIGRRSRWSGAVGIEEFVNFSGTKRYDCSISILDKVAEHPVLRRRTLVHEALHAFSPRYTRTEYDTLIGWEEAVVEQLQRLLRLEVFTRIGVVVDEAELLIGDRQHVYNRYIQCYGRFTRPLGHPGQRVLSSAAGSRVVRAPRAPATAWRQPRKWAGRNISCRFASSPCKTDKKKLGEIQMEREQVIDVVLNASSWEQCQQARHILGDWMKQHPDDWGMLDAGEALEMTMDGLEPPVTIMNKIKQEAAA